MFTMTKPKRKTSHRNPIRYWLDELIFFRRDFLIESSASAEACAEAILSLEPTKAYLTKGQTYIKAAVTPTNSANTTYTFEVYRNQPQKKTHYKSSSVNGTITSDDDGLTFIEGSAKMTGRYYWLSIIGMGFLLYLFVSETLQGRNEIPMILLFAGVVLFMWWTMYHDRNYLINEITAALEAAEKQKNATRLQDDDTVADAIHTTTHNKRDEKYQ